MPRSQRRAACLTSDAENLRLVSSSAQSVRESLESVVETGVDVMMD